MRYRFHDHGLLTEDVRATATEESALLGRHLEHVDDDLKLLDVTIIHHLRDDTYNAKLVLHVLDRVLAADGKGENKRQALRDAFANLSDQLDEFLAKLRSEPEIRDEQRKPAWL